MTCEHCGAPLAPVAHFCGRCGRSVGVAEVPEIHLPPTPEPPAPEPVVPQPRASEPVDVNPEALGGIAAAEPTLLPCMTCGTTPHADDRFCGECGSPVGTPVPPTPAFAESPSVPAPASAPVAVPVVEEPREVVLQVSTGESVAVRGSGLLGRNPRPEPGEVVDHLVIITDPTRSVSKTHLEFGFDGTTFWVSDRHSGNGTVLREPGQLPRFCEPGRRHPVARGTRVDMGDQFLIIG